ncbi:MAG: hypothetical protein RLZZ139_2266 [Cyanobacteriota bacterium]|jgi:hypothetical protein
MKTLLAVIIAIPLAISFSAFFAYVFMLLWNWALVGIFPAVPVLEFYKAWGLTILLSIIGSFFKSSK